MKGSTPHEPNPLERTDTKLMTKFFGHATPMGVVAREMKIMIWNRKWF